MGLNLAQPISVKISLDWGQHVSELFVSIFGNFRHEVKVSLESGYNHLPVLLFNHELQ